MVDLNGKAAIVTGASRGIGRATAVTLARAGADVTVNYYTHGDEAEEVVEQIRESGRSGLAFQADVSDRQAVEAMVDATVGQFGKLERAGVSGGCHGSDGVVSNAYYSKREPFLDLSREAMRRTLDVTLWGAFHVAQAGARRMVAQGTGGSICFISSVLAFIPVATSLPYNAAKAGINQMSATVANELTPHRIRSNVIEPGWIDTPGERQFATDEQIREGAKKVPWKRLGRPEEIAQMAAYLASDAADYITGSVFRVDGGFSLQYGTTS